MSMSDEDGRGEKPPALEKESTCMTACRSDDSRAPLDMAPPPDSPPLLEYYDQTAASAGLECHEDDDFNLDDDPDTVTELSAEEAEQLTVGSDQGTVDYDLEDNDTQEDPTIVSVTDKDGNIVYDTPEFVALTGEDVQAALGKAVQLDPVSRNVFETFGPDLQGPPDYSSDPESSAAAAPDYSTHVAAVEEVCTSDPEAPTESPPTNPSPIVLSSTDDVIDEPRNEHDKPSAAAAVATQPELSDTDTQDNNTVEGSVGVYRESPIVTFKDKAPKTQKAVHFQKGTKEATVSIQRLSEADIVAHTKPCGAMAAANYESDLEEGEIEEEDDRSEVSDGLYADPNYFKRGCPIEGCYKHGMDKYGKPHTFADVKAYWHHYYCMHIAWIPFVPCLVNGCDYVGNPVKMADVEKHLRLHDKSQTPESQRGRSVSNRLPACDGSVIEKVIDYMRGKSSFMSHQKQQYYFYKNRRFIHPKGRHQHEEDMPKIDGNFVRYKGKSISIKVEVFKLIQRSMRALRNEWDVISLTDHCKTLNTFAPGGHYCHDSSVKQDYVFDLQDIPVVNMGRVEVHYVDSRRDHLSTSLWRPVYPLAPGAVGNRSVNISIQQDAQPYPTAARGRGRRTKVVTKPAPLKNRPGTSTTPPATTSRSAPLKASTPKTPNFSQSSYESPVPKALYMRVNNGPADDNSTSLSFHGTEDLEASNTVDDAHAMDQNESLDEANSGNLEHSSLPQSPITNPSGMPTPKSEVSSSMYPGGLMGTLEAEPKGTPQVQHPIGKLSSAGPTENILDNTSYSNYHARTFNMMGQTVFPYSMMSTETPATPPCITRYLDHQIPWSFIGGNNPPPEKDIVRQSIHTKDYLDTRTGQPANVMFSDIEFWPGTINEMKNSDNRQNHDRSILYVPSGWDVHKKTENYYNDQISAEELAKQKDDWLEKMVNNHIGKEMMNNNEKTLIAEAQCIFRMQNMRLVRDNAVVTDAHRSQSKLKNENKALLESNKELDRLRINMAHDKRDQERADGRKIGFLRKDLKIANEETQLARDETKQARDAHAQLQEIVRQNKAARKTAQDAAALAPAAGPDKHTAELAKCTKRLTANVRSLKRQLDVSQNDIAILKLEDQAAKKRLMDKDDMIKSLHQEVTGLKTQLQEMTGEYDEASLSQLLTDADNVCDPNME